MSQVISPTQIENAWNNQKLQSAFSRTLIESRWRHAEQSAPSAAAQHNELSVQ